MKLALMACALLAPATSDWTGRYVAEETAGPTMVMTYTVDVSRSPQGGWRALVAADGHMTYRRLVARGEEKAGALVLRLVRMRSDDMHHVAPAYPADATILTIERRTGGTFALRFGSEGSYLNSAATVRARRSPLPRWAGHYGYRHCAGSECSTWAVDVSLEEEGWVGRVQVDGPGRSERLVARGEEGEELSLGQYLGLLFVSGENAAYKKDVELIKLIQSRDGSVKLRFGALSGPTGIGETNVEMRRER